MKLISINTNDVNFNGNQGIRFEPKIIIKRIINEFASVDVDSVDRVTKRIELIKTLLSSAGTETQRAAYQAMIQEYEMKLPASTFYINDNDVAIEGIVTPTEITFSIKSDDEKKTIPEDLSKKILNFLIKFELKIITE